MIREWVASSRERNKRQSVADSPSNPTLATKLHLVTGLVTMTTCSGHVLRLDFYLLEKWWSDFLVQLNKQPRSVL